ncbi:MAG TPA: trypsin-like peptidase domain-containing protein [Albitalea sp.]|uniref:S1C family serine protease n=1 Tax=Piscinibacter sp. TaxID=1903157 RepID=UPI002ED2690D
MIARLALQLAVALQAAALVACASGPVQVRPGGEPPATFATALARALPWSVGVYGARPRQDATGDERGDAPPWTDRATAARIGAGFFISQDGLVVTAAHVVLDAPEIVAKLDDQRVLRAELLGADSDADIALIRVPVALASAPPFGSSSSVWPGDWVLAVGEPYGLDRSVVAGIVGGRSRHFSEDGALLFIQSDLSLNPGNSGGPLLDTRGQIVGMNLRTVVGMIGGPGLSLSVPIEVVRQIAAEIGGQGGVARPRLGAGFEDVTPLVALARGRPYADGALINEVRPNSVAAGLGLREGDIVVGMNGWPIGDSADFARALLHWRSVERVRITVFREGGYRHLKVAP